MEKVFNSIEEVIADEHFLSWRFNTDSVKAKEWEIWLSQHPQYHSLVDESIVWLNENHLQEREISSEQIEAAHQKMMISISQTPVVHLNKKPRWWIGVAAAIFILIAAGAAYWIDFSGKTSFNTAYGTIGEYQLPDGSHVTLNANSRLTIPKEWKEGSDREVWLQGEGFFKVQKTSMHNRFVVHTTTMDIIVTGTQFNAVCREDESSVLLTEGSVTIRTSDGKEIKMRPGDFVKIENQIPSRQPVDQQRVLAWKEAKLDFENTSMYEVAKIIARHYGVKVNVSTKDVGESTISGIMPNDNLDVLIQALETTGNYKITRTNDEIMISAP